MYVHVLAMPLSGEPVMIVLVRIHARMFECMYVSEISCIIVDRCVRACILLGHLWRNMVVHAQAAGPFCPKLTRCIPRAIPYNKVLTIPTHFDKKALRIKHT